MVKEKEKQILRILEKDARTKPEQIAAMTGLTKDQVTKTIQKAEEDSVIVKYKTVVNWERLGEELVSALIEVKVAPQRDVGFDAIAERIYRFPQVRSLYLVSGTYDLLVNVTGKTMHDVAGFVSQKLAPIEGVQATVTHFLLRRYKEDSEVLNGVEQVKRQAVVL